MKMTLDEKLFNESVYTENGFKDRNDYLNSLADDYGIDISTVKELASILGPSEDFDALVTELEDMMYSKFNNSDEDDDEEYELEKYWLNAYYDYDLRGLEDSIKLYDESEKDDWIWEHCMRGSLVKCTNLDTGEITYYAPPEYGVEVVSPEDLQVSFKEIQRMKDTSDAYDRHVQGYYTGKYESLEEGKGSDIPNYKVLTSKSIIDTDWYGDFDDEEEAENARMEIVDEWDDFLKPSGFAGFYDDDTIYKLHFFNSPFRNDKVIYGTIYDGVEYLAIKDGVDLVKFDSGNLGFISSYNGKLDGFEILGKPTEKELHDYDYGDEVNETLKEGATEDADFIVPIVGYTDDELENGEDGKEIATIGVSLEDLYKRYDKKVIDKWIANSTRDEDKFTGRFCGEFEIFIKSVGLEKWKAQKHNNEGIDAVGSGDRVTILNKDLIPTQVKKLSRFLGKKLLSNQNESLNSQDQYDLSSAIYNAVSDVIFNSGKLDIDEKDVKFAFDKFIKKFFLDESLKKNED